MAPKRGLSGLTIADMKKYPAITPLFLLLGAGMALAITACCRTLVKNPEVSFNRKGNPEPWNNYTERQYKFFGFGRDYSKVKSEAPQYK